MPEPAWTHKVTMTWKIVAKDRSEAWDIADEILRTALCDTPDIKAIHDNTEVELVVKPT